MTTPEEAQTIINQQKQEVERARQEQEAAQAQIEKAKQIVESQKFRRQMSGIQGLRERQKIQSNISQNVAALEQRQQAIEQAQSQINNIQSQINQARGGQAEQSEAYEAAMKAYEKGRPEIAYFSGKKASRIYRDMVEAKESAIKAAIWNLGYEQGVDPDTLKEIEIKLKKDIGKVSSKQLTAEVQNILDAKYQKIDVSVPEIKTENLPNVDVPTSQALQQTSGVITKAPTTYERYKEYIADKPSLRGTKEFVVQELSRKIGSIGPAIEGKSTFEGVPIKQEIGVSKKGEMINLNYVPEPSYYKTGQKLSSAIYFAGVPGIAIAGLEGAESIITSKGREDVSRSAQQLAKDEGQAIVVPEYIGKPALYTLAGLAVAGGAIAGIKSVAKRLPATYETTFVSREVNSNIPNSLQSEQVTRTIRKTVVSENQFLGASKTFTRVEKPIVEGGISKFESVSAGTMQRQFPIAPASNLKNEGQILAYTSKEKGLFQSTKVGDTPVTTVISVNAPGKSAVKTYTPVNPQVKETLYWVKQQSSNVGQAIKRKGEEILTPYFTVRNKVVKAVKTKVNTAIEEGSYWGQVYANQAKKSGQLFWNIQKEAYTGVGRVAAGTRAGEITGNILRSTGNVIKSTSNFIKNIPRPKLPKLPKLPKISIKLPKVPERITNLFAKRKAIGEKKYLSVGFLIGQKSDDSIYLAASRSAQVQRYKKGTNQYWEISNKESVESLGKVITKKADEIIEEDKGYSILRPSVTSQARKKSWQEMDLISQESAKKAAALAAEEAASWRAAQTINRAKVTTQLSSSSYNTLAPGPSPSVYAGTGTYERTDSYVSPLTGQAVKGDVEASINPPTNELKLTGGDNNIFKTKDNQFTGQSDFISQRQGEKIRAKIRLDYSLEGDTKKINTNQIQNPIPKQQDRNIPRVLFKFRQLQKQRTRQINVVKSEIPKAPTTKRPKIRTGLIGFGGGRVSPKVSEVVEDEFSLISFKGGKEFLFAKAKGLAKAIKKARTYVESNLRASFEIRRGKEPVNITGLNIPGFKPSKRNQFRLVQEKTKRLSSGGERSEISFFRRKKERRKKGFF